MLWAGIFATTIQLSSAYLRYLPFSRELSDEKISLLLKSILAAGVFSLAWNLYAFSDGLTYHAYRIAMFPGWLPYVLASLIVIRKKFAQHIFIIGMQFLWTFMLHAVSGMTVAFFYGAMAEELIPLQLFIYLVLFTVLFPLERKFFINLLPSERLFADKSLRRSIAGLPILIFFGAMVGISDVVFFPTWQEKFSHLILPAVFLLIYRSLSLATRQVEEKQLRERKNRALQRQAESMSEHNALMEKSQLEVAELRADLEKNYFAIEKFLTAGKQAEAMKFIRRQTKLLDSTRVKTFCLSPLINAALSIHLSRAEKFGIKIFHKIEWPARSSTDENDLAVLISNLLENAIAASKKNPAEKKISVILRNSGEQNILEIENRFDFPIKIGENGLPYTSEIGHGLGMASLELFAKKYDAFVDFSHEEKIVRLSVYWND